MFEQNQITFFLKRSSQKGTLEDNTLSLIQTCFLQWHQLIIDKHRKRDIINKHRLQQRRYLLFRVLSFMKERADTNILKRRQNLLAQLGHKRKLYIKVLTGLDRNKYFEQNCRYLLNKQFYKYQKLVIQTLVQTTKLWAKYNDCIQSLSSRKARLVLREWAHCIKRIQYKKYLIESADLFNLVYPYKSSFNKFKNYHLLKKNQRTVVLQMRKLYLMKLVKLTLIQWHKHNKRYREERKKILKIKACYEFRLKKTVLDLLKT